MSFYSDSNVKTKYLDPRVYIPNSRATFDLDMTEIAYLPNMKLGFVGVTSTVAHSYNGLVGASAIIRNIRLLDGKTVLSQLVETQFYKGFLNQNMTNAHSQAVDSNLEGNRIGQTIQGSNREVTRVAAIKSANTTADTTDSGYIDLKQYLSILTQLTHLPTAVFNNLRIEIEFNAKPSNQVLGATQGITIETIRPILMVDVLENPTIVDNLNKNMSAVAWSEIEHDQFVIAAAPAGSAAASDGVVQPLNVKLNGYNNKIVDRMLIVKEIADSTLVLNAGGVVQGYGKFGSQACLGQKVQFRVNGRNILPRQGLVGNNERLAFVVDTWGECANFPGSNIYQADTAPVMSSAPQYAGTLDYIAVYLGVQINDLQLNYSRIGVQQTAAAGDQLATTAALIGHVYCEVRKQLIMVGGGQYRVEYIQE